MIVAGLREEIGPSLRPMNRRRHGLEPTSCECVDVSQRLLNIFLVPNPLKYFSPALFAEPASFDEGEEPSEAIRIGAAV
jgi:hypothetical protein